MATQRTNPSHTSPSSLNIPHTNSSHVSPSRPTIHDVAAVSGVSRGTVSRVLNDKGNVSAAAELAVRRAVAETGYVVNRAARSLKTSSTGSIVMILSEPQAQLFEDPNLSTLMRIATSQLAKRDMSLVFMLAGDGDDREGISRYLRGGHADGVLLVSTHAGDPLLEHIQNAGIPAVSCGAILGRESVIPYVAADDRGGARAMTQYLVDQGRSKIAMITGPLDMPGGSLRLEGFTDVLGRKASKRFVAEGDYTQRGGEQAMRELLKSAPNLDAVFVASDLMAAGALRVLHDAGKNVPEDVAVAGFDDSTIAAATRPSLTTVRQPLEEVARETVTLLMNILDGNKSGPAIPAQPPQDTPRTVELTARSIVLPTSLVIRDSA